MRITIDGQLYRLFFRYGEVEQFLSYNHFSEPYLCRKTTAVLERDGGGEAFLGEAICGPTDEFCKDRGRREALKHLLKYAAANDERFRNRKLRGDIWGAYFCRSLGERKATDDYIEMS